MAICADQCGCAVHGYDVTQRLNAVSLHTQKSIIPTQRRHKHIANDCLVSAAMSSESKATDDPQSSPSSSALGSSYTEHDPRARDPLSPLQSRPPKFQRRQTIQRDDLEPGSEYHLTHSRTPARDPNYHDPAIWPDDLVDWDSPKDPANPRNWPLRKKVIVTLQLGLTTMGASFASSSFSPAFTAIQEEFGISRTVAILSLSLFVLGLYVNSIHTSKSLTSVVHSVLWHLHQFQSSMDEKSRFCQHILSLASS